MNSTELLSALKNLARHYVVIMKIGRERIIDLEGECDTVEVMERGDPYLRKAREAIANAESSPAETAEPIDTPRHVFEVTDDALRELWRAHGGNFHGPNVETGTMPEAKLLPFLRSLGARPAMEPSESPISPTGLRVYIQPEKSGGKPDCCLSDPGGGLVCTLPKGHAGQHEAWGARKNLIQSWGSEKTLAPYVAVYPDQGMPKAGDICPHCENAWLPSPSGSGIWHNCHTGPASPIKAPAPPCVYRTGCQNYEACKAESACMSDLAQKLRAQSEPENSCPPSVLDRKVTVCAACLCACCSQGEFCCDQAKTAGTVEKTIRELWQGNLREDSGYWFKDPNTGQVDWDAKSLAKRAWLAETGSGTSGNNG